MSDSNTPSIFDHDGRNGKGSTGDPVDGLVEFAQRHFARDFPNPDRVDCPPSQTYSDLISRGELPDEDMQRHLFACSECFRLYRGFLSTERKPVVSNWTWLPAGVVERPVLTLSAAAGFICAASLFVFGIYSFYSRKAQSPPQQAALSTPSSAAKDQPKTETSSTAFSAPADRSKIQSSASRAIKVQPKTQTSSKPSRATEDKPEIHESVLPSPAKAQRLKEPPELSTVSQIAALPLESRNDLNLLTLTPGQPAVHYVTIDFGRYKVSRSSPQSKIPSVMLLASENKLTVKLSAESPKGNYKLTLHDPFGKEITPPVPGSFDGESLRADLNLGAVRPGKYLICITRAEEVPDCLPAIVTNPLP